jgi:hypothetical protein
MESSSIDDMGRKWFDYLEVVTRDSFVGRYEAQHFDRSAMEPVGTMFQQHRRPIEGRAAVLL